MTSSTYAGLTPEQRAQVLKEIQKIWEAGFKAGAKSHFKPEGLDTDFYNPGQMEQEWEAFRKRGDWND